MNFSKAIVALTLLTGTGGAWADSSNRLATPADKPLFECKLSSRVGTSQAQALAYHQCGNAPYSTVTTCLFDFWTLGDNQDHQPGPDDPTFNEMNLQFSAADLPSFVPEATTVIWIAITPSPAEHTYFWGNEQNAEAHFGVQQQFLNELPTVMVPFSEIQAGLTRAVQIPVLDGGTTDGTINLTDATLSCSLLHN
jgi:hypothetical protein